MERNEFGVALIGLLAEIHFLMKYYEHLLNSRKDIITRVREVFYNAEEIEHSKMVVELAGTKSLLSVLIGVLNFTNLIFVWEQLQKERDFSVV